MKTGVLARVTYETVTHQEVKTFITPAGKLEDFPKSSRELPQGGIFIVMPEGEEAAHIIESEILPKDGNKWELEKKVA